MHNYVYMLLLFTHIIIVVHKYKEFWFSLFYNGLHVCFIRFQLNSILDRSNFFINRTTRHSGLNAFLLSLSYCVVSPIPVIHNAVYIRDIPNKSPIAMEIVNVAATLTATASPVERGDRTDSA